MTLSAGKLRGLRRLSDSDGRFKMLAIDQRPPMAKALAPILAPRIPGYDDIAPIKALLAETLAGDSTAVLVDPDYGFSQSEKHIPGGCGLLITLEDSAFVDHGDGRRTAPFPGLDVAKIKRMGADGVKLLLWYRADAGAEVLAHQQALVRRIGEDCRRYDIPFLLELLVYPFASEANHTTDYIENKTKRPELVLQGLKDFASPDFGVDIYKVESPIASAQLPDPKEASPEVEIAQGWYDEVGKLIDKPWVMLSAGADMEQFKRILTYAYRAGCSGYLAGRAIWWPAFDELPDLNAMRGVLLDASVPYLRSINDLTNQNALAWMQTGWHNGNTNIEDAGIEFPRLYGTF